MLFVFWRAVPEIGRYRTNHAVGGRVWLSWNQTSLSAPFRRLCAQCGHLTGKRCILEADIVAARLNELEARKACSLLGRKLYATWHASRSRIQTSH